MTDDARENVPKDEGPEDDVAKDEVAKDEGPDGADEAATVAAGGELEAEVEQPEVTVADVAVELPGGGPDVDEPADLAEPETVVEGPVVPTDEVAAAIVERFPGAVYHESHGQPVVYVARERWREVATLLRDEQGFTSCMDVTAVDHLLDGTRVEVPGVAPERFEVVANYLAHARNRRIRLVCEVPDAEPEVPSLVPVYPGVDFPEREVFDLFGIVFTDHPDLTRILMPDEWDGHPLRKDAPPARVPVTFKGDPSPR